MCRLHWTDYEEYYDLPGPGPGPLPRLAWALPVDAAELGASIEAYEGQLPRIIALQLCHRFGGGRLSTLPQEILDHVVKLLYRSEKQVSLDRWTLAFTCFQGRCTRMQHLEIDDSAVEGLWDAFFTDTQGCCARHRKDEDLDPDDFDIVEKREMVGDYIENDGDIMYDAVYEAHDTTRDRWLDMLCSCEDTPKTFTRLQKILVSHFGVEATFLHEVLPFRLSRFLPDTNGLTETSYYTSCFLTLPRQSVAEVTPETRTEAHTNHTFLKSNTHLAFHQRIDIASLGISEKQRASFARALRILDVRPSFHLTELDSSLIPSTKDDALWKICDAQLEGCPKATTESLMKKKERLKRYLERKNDELGKQLWPQFMMMAASDVVTPVG